MAASQQRQLVNQRYRHVIAIGDLHGCHDTLIAFLEQIGCEVDAAGYRVPDDILLVFLGDLIDRGPKSRETVATVRALVESGQAYCIVGNHEFNAVLYHTPDPERPGEFVRRHTSKNRKQIAATLSSYEGHEQELTSDLAWFRTLPVAIELEGLRCVHACWDTAALGNFRRRDNAWYLPEDQWVEAGTEGNALFDAVERICKGPEATMPLGGYYNDKDGNQRYKARVAWWQAAPRTWSECFRLPSNIHGFDPAADCDIPPPSAQMYGLGEPPVVFGHYWLSGTPAPLTPNAACLDYSAVRGGKLVGYRHEAGAGAIEAQNLIWVEARDA